MNKMKDIEKQFITSCQSFLTDKGEEICKEILVMIGEKDEMKRMKAKVFCEFFLSYELEDSKLKEKCKNYLDYLYDFQRYYHAFKAIGIERKEKLDMRNMRITNF